MKTDISIYLKKISTLMILLFNLIQYEYYAAGSNYLGKLGLRLSLQYSNLYNYGKQTTFFDDEIAYIGAGQQNGFAITKRGSVYGWGDNEGLQLATSDVTASNSPLIIQYFFDNNVSLVQIECGVSHAIALDVNGVVYTWGSNFMKQLARDTVGMFDQCPTPVDSARYNNEVVKQIKASNAISYMLTSAGNIFAFGMCANGSCGELINNKIQKTFTAAKMFVGPNSLFVQSDNGTLYATGSNSFGELCFDPSMNDKGSYQGTLKRIFGVQGIDEAAIGPVHSLFKIAGSVYGCGSNADHQMGNVSANLKIPTLFYQNDALVAISACQAGSIFLIQDKVYVVGSSLAGELGTNLSLNNSALQIQIDGKQLTDVLCRKDFSIIYSKSYDETDNSTYFAIIIGCSVGGVVLVIIITILLIYCLRTHKMNKYHQIESKETVSITRKPDVVEDDAW